MVLETDGTFTVVRKIEGPDKPTLENVRGYERRAKEGGGPGEPVAEQSRQAGR